jgi:hypothetical protein
MNVKDALLRELERLSDPGFQEAIAFIRFLRHRAAQEILATASLSESVLSKDWLRPEEDEAWHSL